MDNENKSSLFRRRHGFARLQYAYALIQALKSLRKLSKKIWF